MTGTISGSNPVVLVQSMRSETIARASVGGGPSAGRALMKRDVGAMRRIEKNVAG